MKTARLVLGLALLATALMAADCPFAIPFRVPLNDVVLFNNSNQAIHILTEGESFAPGNQLQPDNGRIVRERLVPDVGIMFRAGRNGQVLDTVECTPTDSRPFTDPTVNSLNPEVIWNGAALVCVGWAVT